MEDRHGLLRTYPHTGGGQLVKVIATPADTSEVEPMSPIQPADRPHQGSQPVLLFCHQPDFPSTRYYRKQRNRGHAGGGGCACVRSKLLAIFWTEALARLPRPHSPLTDGLRCLPTVWEGELGHGRGPVFPFPVQAAPEAVHRAAPGDRHHSPDSSGSPRGKAPCGLAVTVGGGGGPRHCSRDQGSWALPGLVQVGSVHVQGVGTWRLISTLLREKDRKALGTEPSF